MLVYRFVDLFLLELVVLLFHQLIRPALRFGFSFLMGLRDLFRVLAGGGSSDGVDTFDVLDTVGAGYLFAELFGVLEALGAERVFRDGGDDLHRGEARVVEVLF